MNIGDQIELTETCRRGCCNEFHAYGTIVGEHDNGTFSVKITEVLPDSKTPATVPFVQEYVSSMDMKVRP